MQQTSLEAFKQLDLAIISNKYKLIIECLAKSKYPLTDREIAHRLNFVDPNKIRPRRNELVKLGIVLEDNKRNCTITNKKAITWRVR